MVQHHCCFCDDPANAQCVKKGHIAICEICKSGFQPWGGCVKHEYHDDFNMWAKTTTKRQKGYRTVEEALLGGWTHPNRPKYAAEVNVDLEALKKRKVEADKAVAKRATGKMKLEPNPNIKDGVGPIKWESIKAGKAKAKAAEIIEENRKKREEKEEKEAVNIKKKKGKKH